MTHNPAWLSDRQLAKARHALGLDNRDAAGVSYRNHYVTPGDRDRAAVGLCGARCGHRKRSGGRCRETARFRELWRVASVGRCPTATRRRTPSAALRSLHNQPGDTGHQRWCLNRAAETCTWQRVEIEGLLRRVEPFERVRDEKGQIVGRKTG